MQEKILCLGNNTEDTDHQTRSLCGHRPYHGLLSDLDRPVRPEDFSNPGFYHSSVLDIEFGRLLQIMDQFDQITVLDQPLSQWNHADSLYKTLRLVSKTTTPVRFLNPDLNQTFSYFSDLVKTNKSFCIFPFIEMLVNFDHTTVCCRSNTPVQKLTELKDYQHDENYKKIRQKMLQGQLVPEHCGHCYRLEHQGITSSRQQETVEWAQRLDIKSTRDLLDIKQPVYYEIRPGNKCNLLCRTCSPTYSHLIEKEYRRLDMIPKNQKIRQKHTTGFDIIDFDSAKKIYVAGGEPTTLKEFYRFLEDCISQNRTDVELLINTNGTNINPILKKYFNEFSNLHFIFSIDGYQELNHYIRWPSDWSTIIENWQYLRSHDHKISINTTVSIYNVDKLDILCEFIDRQFPNSLVHWQIVESPKFLSPYLHPDKQRVMVSLQKIKTMQCYKNDALMASAVDGIYRLFQQREGIPNLDDFFEYNDKLDRSRDIALKDYCPDIDRYRFLT